jgi:hypothetical protein
MPPKRIIDHSLDARRIPSDIAKLPGLLLGPLRFDSLKMPAAHTFEPDDDSEDDDVFSAPRAYKQTQQRGSQEYGHGSPDTSGIRAPQDDAERAYQERTQRGDQAWRTGSAVGRANANQARNCCAFGLRNESRYDAGLHSARERGRDSVVKVTNSFAHLPRHRSSCVNIDVRKTSPSLRTRSPSSSSSV